MFDEEFLTKYAVMHGTNQHYNYLVLAQTGSYLLGLKPETIRDASMYGHIDGSVVQARLRSAHRSSLHPNFENMAGPTNALQFDEGDDPAGAFPNIKWEQINASRASMVMTGLFEGNIRGAPDSVRKLIKRMTDGTIATKLINQIAGMIAPVEFIRPADELIDILNVHYFGKVAEKLEESLAQSANVKEAFGGDDGGFIQHAEFIKKLNGKTDDDAQDEAA